MLTLYSYIPEPLNIASVLTMVAKRVYFGVTFKLETVCDIRIENDSASDSIISTFKIDR